MSFPVELVPQPSRLMMAGLVAGHFVLGLAFLLSSLPPALIGVASAGLILSGVTGYQRWRRRANLRFILGEHGILRVIPPAGNAYDARATRSCRDLGWAVWLAWRSTAEAGNPGPGEADILMLPRDALSPDTWRALRIWLKFRSGLSAPSIPEPARTERS